MIDLTMGVDRSENTDYSCVNFMRQNENGTIEVIGELQGECADYVAVMSERIADLELRIKEMEGVLDSHITDISRIPSLLRNHLGSNFERTAKEIEKAIMELTDALK